MGSIEEKVFLFQYRLFWFRLYPRFTGTTVS